MLRVARSHKACARSTACPLDAIEDPVRVRKSVRERSCDDVARDRAEPVGALALGLPVVALGPDQRPEMHEARAREAERLNALRDAPAGLGHRCRRIVELADEPFDDRVVPARARNHEAIVAASRSPGRAGTVTEACTTRT